MYWNNLSWLEKISDVMETMNTAQSGFLVCGILTLIAAFIYFMNSDPLCANAGPAFAFFAGIPASVLGIVLVVMTFFTGTKARVKR